jgi:hypothetical protein
MSVWLNNGSGFAVTTCPIVASFEGIINSTSWPGVPSGVQIGVQSEWIGGGTSSFVSQPQAIGAVTGQGGFAITGSTWWIPATGTYWVASKIISPSMPNSTSNLIKIKLTCPTTVNGKKVNGSFSASPWKPQ